MELSLRAYARHRGVTLHAVQKAVTAGRIEKTPNGKIDCESADIAWLKNSAPRPARISGQSAPVEKPRDKPADVVCPVVAEPEKPPKREPQVEVDAVPSQPILDGLDYYAARAASETYKARLAQLEYELRTGKLVPAEQVQEAAYAIARTVRDALLNLPDRLAAILAAESDPAKTHQVLTDEIRKALNELATGTGDSGPGAPGLSPSVQPRPEA